MRQWIKYICLKIIKEMKPVHLYKHVKGNDDDDEYNEIWVMVKWRLFLTLWVSCSFPT